MNIGIKFKILNEYGNYIKQILNNIDSANYIWKIAEDEVSINNYEDFLKSICILVLFITDNEFVEIYSKDENILKVIYENALENEFSDIKYITENDSKRKTFSAYSD